MKIAFFLPNATFDRPGSPEVGGIETFAFAVGEALQQLGHKVSLYGGRPKEGRTHRPTTLDLRLFDYIETRNIPDLGTRFQRLVQRLHFGMKCRKDFLAGQFDVVMVAKPFDWPVIAGWKRRQPRLKAVMSFQGTDFFWGDKFFYKAVDGAFAVSRTVADLAFQRVGRRPEVIPNPVDTSFFTPIPKELEKGSDHPFHVVSCGRLVGWKGFEVLVGALLRLKKEGIAIRCTIAGDGPEKARLAAMISEQGAGDAVCLAGVMDREQLRALYAGADVFVAPSVGLEAFSIAALEGASCGLPLILSDQVGLGEFLGESDCVTYPCRDEGALADKIRQRMKFPRPTPEDRRARHAQIEAGFSATASARKILELIGKL